MQEMKIGLLQRVNIASKFGVSTTIITSARRKISLGRFSARSSFRALQIPFRFWRLEKNTRELESQRLKILFGNVSAANSSKLKTYH